MKVSTENIGIINKRLERLYDEFNINPLNEDEVKIGDEDIFISYPDDNLEEPISVDDFMLYTSNLDGINKEDDSTVRMDGIRQTILRVDCYHLNYLVPDVSYSDDLIDMGIIENPVLIGLVASKEGIYNEEFGVFPCSMYTALELRYKTEQRYTKDEEDKIIERFFYHIAAKYDISIEVGTFDSWEDITDEEPPEPYQLQKDSLIPYSEAMRYYANALRINDPDIQFHHLYKIVEHFSPRVSKKMAYEMLNQRLDTLSIVNRDCQYLDSLLELAKHYQTSLKDKELCKTVLQECVDIIPIFDLLPEEVQINISRKCSFKIEEIGNCADSIIAKIKDELGEVIYETRNRIVHAKSNWGGSDKACSGDDMEEMNDFMKALAQCLIIWNGRQPQEFRI